jgi:endonuclease III
VSAPGRRRYTTFVRRLTERFGQLDPPRRTDPLAELILTVLSQHTSDRNAERAFAELRSAFPGWDEVVSAPTEEVARAIRSGGLGNTKAPRIQTILSEIAHREGGYDLGALHRRSDDEVRAYLSSLPGVGPKTAAVVMAFSLGRAALPVDTHVHRVTRRLGLVPARSSAEQAYRVLEQIVPVDLKIPLHVGWIRLGREICRPGRPRCEVCPLIDLCPTAPVVLGRPVGRRPRRTSREADRSG